MTVRKSSPPVDEKLTDLADAIAEEFEDHRDPDGFKQISLVIDNSHQERQTLIVHVNGDSASEVADEIENYLEEHPAHTQREYHDDDDIRVLITL